MDRIIVLSRGQTIEEGTFMNYSKRVVSFAAWPGSGHRRIANTKAKRLAKRYFLLRKQRESFGRRVGFLNNGAICLTTSGCLSAMFSPMSCLRLAADRCVWIVFHLQPDCLPVAHSDSCIAVRMEFPVEVFVLCLFSAVRVGTYEIPSVCLGVGILASSQTSA